LTKPGIWVIVVFRKVYREGEYYRDNWGCLWYSPIGGLEGQVVESPLADWDAMDSYRPPDYLTQGEREPRDWQRLENSIRERREKGKLTMGDGERLFDRLYFLRGFENLMIDIANEDPRLGSLIGMLTEYEKALVDKWLEIGVDIIGFHTDIGTQDRLMIRPRSFRKYIKPMFQTLFSACRKAGTHVLLSSDGNLLEIVDDLIECGVSVHDPRLRANTLEGIEKHYKGKLCINLDLDRQGFAFCRPEDIWDQVREAADRLALAEGGLMMSGSVYDDSIPLENIEALCDAIETVCLKSYSA
jgi:uroporphyrinogen decarboxylase